jgi:hypothetical protein
MVLRPKEREIRVREIRNTLLIATRAQTPSGALKLLREAADQLTVLLKLETGGETANEADGNVRGAHAAQP